MRSAVEVNTSFILTCKYVQNPTYTNLDRTVFRFTNEMYSSRDKSRPIETMNVLHKKIRLQKF